MCSKNAGNIHEVPQQVNGSCSANLVPTLWCWASILWSKKWDLKKRHKKEDIVSHKGLEILSCMPLPNLFPTHKYLRIYSYMSAAPNGGTPTHNFRETVWFGYMLNNIPGRNQLGDIWLVSNTDKTP